MKNQTPQFLATAASFFPELIIDLWQVANHADHGADGKWFDVANGQHIVPPIWWVIYADVVGTCVKSLSMFEIVTDLWADPVPFFSEWLEPWPPVKVVTINLGNASEIAI